MNEFKIKQIMNKGYNDKNYPCR